MSERLRPAARRVDHDFLLASDICVVEMADSEDSLVSSPPPTLRPVVDINSNSEDEVGNPTSDLNDPLQLLGNFFVYFISTISFSNRPFY